MVCDFQAVYHLNVEPEADEFAGLSSVQFFRYASRLPWYDGAVTAAFARIRADVDRGSQPIGQQPAQTMDASPLNLRVDPVLSQFVEYG